MCDIVVKGSRSLIAISSPDEFLQLQLFQKPKSLGSFRRNSFNMVVPLQRYIKPNSLYSVINRTRLAVIGRVLKYAPECFEVLLCRSFIIKQTAQQHFEALRSTLERISEHTHQKWHVDDSLLSGPIQSNPMRSDGRRQSSLPVSCIHSITYKLVYFRFQLGRH